VSAPLLFVTRQPPVPDDNGARIRTLRLARGLAERFDLTLLSFADGPAYDSAASAGHDLGEALPGARVELVPYGNQLPRGARRDVLKRRSDTMGHYDTPTLRAAIAQLLAERPGSVLHLDDPGVALAGLGQDAALVAAAPHNVEHRIIRDIARRMPPAHRVFNELEWRKLAAEERRIWRRADLCVAVSNIDAATMRAGGARDVVVCPNGSDPHDIQPLPPLAADEPLRLLFVGALRFWPYVYGVTWFVTEALPALDGPVAVDVVGEHDGTLPEAAGVTYHGRVESVLPYYRRAHALVLPVFEGSGTRLKVVEAALLGRPIVSTALGVEGLGLREGEHYLRAEDAAGFAAAVARLRGELERADPALLARRDAAREAVAELTWPRIADALADRYSTSVR
jgi:glycosyltransferase involved in cell wall biosynthesis